MMMKKSLLNSIFLSIALSLGLIDQYTKGIALAALKLVQPLAIFPGFNFTLAYNEGVAFSLFHDAEWAGKLLLLGFILSLAVFVTVWMLKLSAQEIVKKSALCFILGGAIGNIYDRIMRGFVVDFLDFYYKEWHWPYFNAADVFIFIGAVMLIFIVWREE